MEKKKLEKLKEGQILIDDCGLAYEVVEVFKKSAVVSSLKDASENYSCEIMTFKAMENEGWYIANR